MKPAGTAWTKIVLGVLAGLLALLFAAILAAPLLIDRDALIDTLEASLQEALARPVTIEAMTSLRLLPAPSLELASIQIRSDDPSAPPVAHVDRLRLHAALLPLLSGRLELSEVLVEGADVRLDGGARPPADAGRPPEPGTGAKLGEVGRTQGRPARTLPVVSTEIDSSERRTDARQSPEALAIPPIDRLILRDCTLTRFDVTAAVVFRAGDLFAEAGPIRLGESGRLTATLVLETPTQLLNTPVELDGPFALTADGSRIMLAPFEMRLPRLGLGAAAADPRLAATLRGKLSADILTGMILLEDLRANAGQLHASAEATLRAVNGDPRLTGHAVLPPFDLRAWLADYGYPAVPGLASTLRHVGADFDFDLAGRELSLDRGELRIDDSQASAAARLRLPGQSDRLPTGIVAIALDRLELDPYLTPPIAATDLPEAPATVSPANPNLGARPRVNAPDRPPLPAVVDSVPRATQALTLRLNAGQLGAGGLHYDALRLSADFDAAGVRSEAEAGFYGGRLRASGGARSAPAGAGPLLILDATGSDVDIAPLLRDLQAGRAGKPVLRGRADFELDLSARGADPAAVRASVGGSASLAARDGAVTLPKLDRLIAGSLGERVDDIKDLTEFSALSLTAKGRDGRFHSGDIRMRSTLLHVDGSGDVDFPKQTLAVDLAAVMVEAPDGRGIRELEGIAIPITAKGSWTNPNWQVDLRPALNAAARRALREDSDLLDKLEERTGVPGLGDSLRQMLPGLLGR